MIRSKFSDKDRGFAKWNRALRFLGGRQSDMEIGLLEGDASPEAIFKGAVNEVGTLLIPARPWFRHTFDKNRKKYLDFLQKRWLRALEDGKTTDRSLKAEVGHMVVEDLRRGILSGPWERNAASTIKKKGFDWPLVETGELSKSVSYRIVPRKASK